MFPLQRGNELVIQFSRSPDPQNHQSKISEDPILDDYASPRVSNSDKKIGNTARGNILSQAISNNNSPNENKKKKMIHREIERQRRQEMASLYASLRSLLPLEYIKGKRSISDHMNEAVTYIKHLQKKIKELGDKRDELKKHSSDNSNLETPDEGQQKSVSFTVHENNGVVGIEIISNFKDERFSVSKLLELLLEEGLEVVTCLFTQVNGRILHSLHCEVNCSNSVDLSELRRKIASFIS
ncbi:transcription factor bHLH118-like [Neltuma alba]|uniref:transcription factor bHLH118-like n=1 Tax=Neltuma alba TaxID=207710 RepID=UPI0010A415C5|nr:transcription factor bHLH118-like [Prosopis alba]